MNQTWEIGEEARNLDEGSIKDRFKIERKSLFRIFGAFGFYIFVMLVFYYFL